MSYLHDESNEQESLNIKDQYKKSVTVDNDEADFLNFNLKIAKWEREVVFLNGEFHDGELGGYEAKTRLLALLDIMVETRDELMKTL